MSSPGGSSPPASPPVSDDRRRRHGRSQVVRLSYGGAGSGSYAAPNSPHTPSQRHRTQPSKSFSPNFMGGGEQADAASPTTPQRDPLTSLISSVRRQNRSPAPPSGDFSHVIPPPPPSASTLSAPAESVVLPSASISPVADPGALTTSSLGAVPVPPSDPQAQAAPTAATLPAEANSTSAAPSNGHAASSSARPADEVLEKHRYQQGPASPIGPASVFNILTVWWANALVVLGNKRPLDDADIPELPLPDQSQSAFHEFLKHWKVYRDLHPRGSVWRALLKSFYGSFLLGGVSLVFGQTFLVLQPVFVQQVVNVLEDPDTPSLNGYMWSIALILTTFLSSIFTNGMFFCMVRFGNRSRVACLTAIYEKALLLSRASRQQFSTGSTVNIMSNDTQRLFEASLFFHFIWLAPIIIITALILMIIEVGVAAVAGVALLCCLTPFQVYISRLTGRNRRVMLKYSDQRVKLMAEILQGIRVVKLYAWEQALAQKIEEIRQKEIGRMRYGLYLQAANQTLLFTTPAAVTAIIMCVYAALGNEVNVSNTFAILAYINIIRNPTQLIPLSINALAEAGVALKRIEAFLSLPELTPPRRQPYDSSIPYAITVRNGTFVWSPDQSTPTLRDITLNIKPGSLVAIIGQVGAGKSSIINAMLGEMLQVRPDDFSKAPPEDEQVLINGSIAYVSQESWIRNDTVKGNILFGLPYVQHKYEQVLEASCLKHDLSILPNGEATEIGERGVNLSGGQKQRMSMARALYRHELCDIYLLDDPFSAVDMSVGVHIFQHALRGMLRNKTRVMVLSSHLHLLEHFDQIIVVEQMKKEEGEDNAQAEQANGGNGAPAADAAEDESSPSLGGHIAAVGTFSELKQKYAALMSQREEVEEEEDDEEEETMEEPIRSPRQPEEAPSLDYPVPVPPFEADEDAEALEKEKEKERVKRLRTTSRASSRRLASHTSHSRSRRRSHSKAGADAKSDELVKSPPTASLIEKEDRQQGAVGIDVWVQYFSSGEKTWGGVALLMFVILLFVLGQGARVMADMWVSWWAARTMFDEGDNFWITVYFCLIGLTLLLSLARSFNFMSNVCMRASRKIHDTSFKIIMHASIPLFFDVTPQGRIINRFSKDLDQMDNLLPTTMFALFQNVFILVGVVAICITGSWIMVPLLVPITCMFFGVQRYFRNSQRELKRIENTTRSPIFSLFAESLNGLSVIRAYGVEDEFRLRNRNVVETNSKVFSIQWWTQRWLALRLDWVALLIVVAISMIVVSLRDSMAVELASLALVYSLQFTGLLQLATRNSVDAENYLTSVERLMAFSSITSEKPDYIPENEPPADWPQKGHIVLENLQLRYRPDLPLVLKGVSCSIQPREKIGVCGRTGSGKSTIFQALFRVVEPCGGTIFIDGVDIGQIGLQTLRKGMSIIPQDPVMFSADLRYNLDPFNQCSDAEIHAVLDRVHLSDMVANLEGGLRHEVSENGENFSQGQRQMVCIARALLRKSKIIVLDEATSSVDAETDALIQDTIRTNFADATVLTIAHRLETIVDSDRIMLLSDGQLAEFDAPSTLLSDPNSRFRQLVLEGGAANLARYQALAREADVQRQAQRKSEEAALWRPNMEESPNSSPERSQEYMLQVPHSREGSIELQPLRIHSPK